MSATSLFDFRLIRQIPKPSGSLAFCLAFFVLLHIVLTNDHSVSLDDLSGAVEGFVLQERSEQAEHPMILVGGSSRNGMGIHMDVLEQRAGAAAGKIACNSGEPDFAFQILEIFEKECQNVKLLIIDIVPISLEDVSIKKTRRRFYEQEINSKNKLTVSYASNLFERRPFIDFYREWKDCFFFHDKEVYRFEDRWYKRSYRRMSQIRQKELRIVRDLAKKKDAKIEVNNILKNDESFEIGTCFDIFDSEILNKNREIFFACLEKCQQKGIYVVFNSTPRWYGLPCIKQSDIDLHSSNSFYRLLAELNQLPNCTVVACGYFEEIDPQAQDEDYLFDHGHMTEEGAALYTNWLMDRLFETDEVAALFPNPVLAQPQPKMSSQFEP